MQQIPFPDSYFLRWVGDKLDVTLKLPYPRKGRAVFRTEIGGATVARRETIEENDLGITPLEKDWSDFELSETTPGTWHAEIPLMQVGIFRGKCCFFAEGSSEPQWSPGGDFSVKVCSAETRNANSIYTVFPRQFGSFREVIRRLDFIMGKMGFNIIQTLPVFPVPTSYAVMGEYGCPFAATDFFSVDPAMAEFDTHATPLDQFRELIEAVHARGGRIFVDLPANHTGWASALQTHHPEWFKRKADGEFISPGAWGVVWADLVELDYSHQDLRAYMAEVFLFWVRNGVDGFRCDAGYMIPEPTWKYIVARVREEYPDTVFMLEGLGGKLEVTDALLNRAGLDWAYSEIFQTYDRGAFEWYMPGAIDRARRFGALVHFAETHDNDRLAKRGKTWAAMRVALCALLSHQGAWGIANGVEWLATEKIDVHGKNDLNWGAKENIVDFIAKLNHLIARHIDFTGNEPIALIQRGEGNFLAVLRGSTLILANLDCERGVKAHWDDKLFPASSDPYDLLADKIVHLEEGKWLEPGEVRVVTHAARNVEIPTNDASLMELPNACAAITWTFPDDTTRDVCVPSGSPLRVVAPHPFRIRINDGEKTLVVRRSVKAGDSTNFVRLPLPEYSGDGTRANVRDAIITVYAPGEVIRRKGRIMILPPGEDARVKLVYSGAEIRRNRAEPGADGLLETVLSNGAGSASRVKLAWGEIRSQYDAFLSANTNPNVPADRLTLWTRCRCWLNYEGTTREINADYIESFRADPQGRFAEWTFVIPCRFGRVAKFLFTLSLAQDTTPAARLAVKRIHAGKTDVGAKVKIIFRPELEWRSFHATTKAQGPVESAFNGALHNVTDDSFDFVPYGNNSRLSLKVDGGKCHAGVEWNYCVSHAEEAARGQDGSGDLFSPAWIDCDFANDSSAAITAVYNMAPGNAKPRFDDIKPTALATCDLPGALRDALRLFIVKRDDVKTVIAGYPWFLDWGRDTFIFLQGAIPGGFEDEALAIVEAFARFEENGTLPNIIYGQTAGNRDTVDAPLWFIRTLAVLGDKAVKFRPVAESIVENYVKGTPNGIHMDPDSALIWSPSHFTWMDTNYPACTPRIGYPVEIQALWIAALRYLGGEKFNDLADRAVSSLVRYFSKPGEKPGLADCLDAPAGESAADAKADWGIRPNQLFVLSLDALEGVDIPGIDEIKKSVVRACERLVVPGGVRSLALGDARYRGIYAGDEDTSRKPAYHNGTVWAWPFAQYAEALVKTGLATKEAALSLLASSVENLNGGCVCHISEIADGDTPHAQKGCRAQAWSVSELLRVWLKLSES